MGNFFNFVNTLFGRRQSDGATNQNAQYPSGPRGASASAYPPPAVHNQQHLYSPYGQAPTTYPTYPSYPSSGSASPYPPPYPTNQPYPNAQNSRQPSQAPQPPPPRANDGALQQTSTIRNAVNLKKPSLKLVPAANDPEELEVHFSFDSSKPCSVTTFFVATEDINSGCGLSGMRQAPGKRILYNQGLGLAFPPAEGAKGHSLRLKLHDLEDLKAQKGDRWPLVIRLETVNEDKSGGRTLKDLPEGSAQPNWVQSQTTFAELLKDPRDDQWKVRVKRQKIWVDETSYELQEIYGMDMADGSAEQANTADIDNGSECVICMSNRKDTTVLPCRHMCMCSDCANQLRYRTNKCPICRETVDSLLHIKLQSKAQASAEAAAGPSEAPRPDARQDYSSAPSALK